MKESASDLIENLHLERHVEGGWFKRTYESQRNISLSEGTRPCGTSILYLLEKEDYSRLHSLKSDETWYYHKGNSLELILFESTGFKTVQLGNAIDAGQIPQYTIGAGTIFGALPFGEEDWSLVSCSVSPGFDYADFMWPDIHELITRFPEKETLLKRLSQRV